MSAEFDEDYEDKKTGEKVGAVLLGAALVNQPANPYVTPLVLADNINNFERNDDSMNELEDLRRQLSEAIAQKSQLEATLQTERDKASKEAEEAAKKLADIEAQNKALVDERERIENERNEAEVKAFCDNWTAKGIPPAVVEKVKPLLLAKTSRTIKLSDDAKDETPSLKFFGELFEAMPKVSMGQNASSGTQPIQLSDYEKAVALGKAIADVANS